MLRPLSDIFESAAYPDLLVGLGSPDDAAVYRLNADQAIISTMDFFPPVLDDPYDFGRVAAANALSDIYAMGGEPLFAINLVAFPDDLDPAILTEILRGGAEVVKSAGAVIAGGHSVIDKEPKYGMAVTGLVRPGRILAKGGARPGDRLLLTKPLGTGTITTAHKRGDVDPDHLAGAVRSMTRLNREAARAAAEAGAHALTDITGFGLAGHAHEMAHPSGLTVRIDWDALPWIDGAETYARKHIFPGGMDRNRLYYEPWVTLSRPLEEWQSRMLFDPQTSGGLLAAVAPEDETKFLEHMGKVGEPVWRIGQAVVGDEGRIEIA